MIHELYLNLKTRNARAKELKLQGYSVKVSTSSNQLIHPQHIVDWVGPEKNDTGFGNTVYKTHVAKLYVVEVR